MDTTERYIFICKIIKVDLNDSDFVYHFPLVNVTNENIQAKRKHTVNIGFHRFLVCPKHPMNAFCHKGDDQSWTGLLTEERVLNINTLVT